MSSFIRYINELVSASIIGVGSGIVILLAGIAMKAFHWPGASTLAGVGVLIIISFFLALIFLGFYRNNKTSGYPGISGKKLFYISAYLATSLFLLASYLKILHWPGSETLVVTSILILNFEFLPMLMIKLYRMSSGS